MDTLEEPIKETVMFWLLNLSFVFLALMASPSSWAYLTILESGEPLTRSEMHIGFAPQFLTGDTAGSNGGVTLRTGLDEGRDFSLQVGGGKVQFWTTLATRWIPIPDYRDQPAIGLRFDVTMARMSDSNTGVLRAAPFVSKRFKTDVGYLEPYAYLPLGMTLQNGTYDNVSSLTLGSQLMLEDLRPIFFYGEVGLNLKNSVSYFTIGIFSTFDR